MRYLSLTICMFLIAYAGPLAWGESGNPIANFDRRAFEFIYEDLGEPTLRSGMRGVTHLGDSRIIISGLLLLSAFGDKKKLETAKLGASAFGVSGISIYALKELIGRSRPLELVFDSFPSGHSGFAFAIARIISYQYPKLTLPAYVVAASVGFSRIYLGRHYPSDVVVGALVGSIIAEGVIRYKDTILKLEF